MSYVPVLSEVVPKDYWPKTCDICGKVLASIDNEEVDTYIYRGPFDAPEQKHLCLDCWDKLWNGRQI